MRMNVGNLFQGVNISELMKNLDILGDNGVTMSDRFLVLLSRFDWGILCDLVLFLIFFSDLKHLRSKMEGFCVWLYSRVGGWVCICQSGILK